MGKEAWQFASGADGLCAAAVLAVALAACSSASTDAAPSSGSDQAGSNPADASSPGMIPTAPSACPKEGCGVGKWCTTVHQAAKAFATCRLLCAPGDSCGSGQVCRPFTWHGAAGVCVLRCENNTQCPEGFGCDVASGQCRCSSDAMCKASTTNALLACDDGQCRVQCGGDNQCACGSTCSGGVCKPGCHSDKDCCGGGTCKNGTCASGPPGGLGAHCAMNSDCASKLGCAFQAGEFPLYPRGMCIGGFAASCQGAKCSAGTACLPITVEWQGEPLGLALCAPRCDDGPCPDGSVCRTALQGGPKVCVPACDHNAAFGCGLGALCDDQSSACLCLTDDACLGLGAKAKCVGGACSCTPDCAGRQCGGDGCGGTCGQCGSGLQCDPDTGKCAGVCGGTNLHKVCGKTQGGDELLCPANTTCVGSDQCSCPKGYEAQTCAGTLCNSNCEWPWQCVQKAATCQASCAGRNCGPDGCGGSCGTCPLDATCSAYGQCSKVAGGCAPQCGGKQCGSNGCGGTCGSCPSGSSCTSAGTCTTVVGCTPSCAGKQCGPNGCGGLCGSCAAGAICSGGACVKSCTPNCSAKQCGSDGCGGSCGLCSPGAFCNGGACMKSCTPSCAGKQCGPDGCGGSCGSCSSGSSCTASGTCQATSSGAKCVYYNNCVSQPTFKWNKSCGDPKGASVTFTNVCNQALDFKICLKRCNGTWDCGSSRSFFVRSSRVASLSVGRSRAHRDFWSPLRCSCRSRGPCCVCKRRPRKRPTRGGSRCSPSRC